MLAVSYCWSDDRFTGGSLSAAHTSCIWVAALLTACAVTAQNFGWCRIFHPPAGTERLLNPQAQQLVVSSMKGLFCYAPVSWSSPLGGGGNKILCIEKSWVRPIQSQLKSCIKLKAEFWASQQSLERFCALACGGLAKAPSCWCSQGLGGHLEHSWHLLL